MSLIAKIKLRRLPEAQTPTLDQGEPFWATDTKKLFVGNGDGTSTEIGGSGGGGGRMAFLSVSMSGGSPLTLTEDQANAGAIEVTD